MLEDAVTVLRHVKIETNKMKDEKARIGTMLGEQGYQNQQKQTGRSPAQDDHQDQKKIRMEEIKSTTSCLECGKIVHWFKYRVICMNIMEESCDVQ